MEKWSKSEHGKKKVSKKKGKRIKKTQQGTTVILHPKGEALSRSEISLLVPTLFPRPFTLFSHLSTQRKGNDRDNERERVCPHLCTSPNSSRRQSFSWIPLTLSFYLSLFAKELCPIHPSYNDKLLYELQRERRKKDRNMSSPFLRIKEKGQKKRNQNKMKR